MARILIITTGGTIASIESSDGLVPGMSSQQLLSRMPRIPDDIELKNISLFHIDSTDMTVNHWMKIIGAIRDNYDDFDGFVVCHGTDTMAYTAAILSYMIQDSPKPIVLTGAQKPIGFEITDAKSNLQDSILYAADPHSKGVVIVFAGKVIAGTHARKIRSQLLQVLICRKWQESQMDILSVILRKGISIKTKTQLRKMKSPSERPSTPTFFC